MARDIPRDRPKHDLGSTIDLLEKVRDGDDGALEELYHRYLNRMRRWAHRRLPYWARDLMDTDDLVQETLLKTLRSVETFEPEHSGAFQAYLCRAVRNKIQDEMRRVRRRPGLAETIPEDARDFSPSPLEEAIGSEVFQRYESALESLRPKDKEAIIGRVELCFSYAELATIMGKNSPDSARMVVKRALVQLAQAMAHG